MATSKRCSVCNKEAGVIFCPGCDVFFCMKDFRSHRENLSTELDGIIGKRDYFQEQISQAVQYRDSASPFLAQIDEWETAMVQKVEQMAEQVRQEIIELLNSRQLKLTNQFETFSQELTQLKESENFIEQDLVRLQQLLEQFNEELKQLSDVPAIQLHTENYDRINWKRLIYIAMKSNPVIDPQKQVSTTSKSVN